MQVLELTNRLKIDIVVTVMCPPALFLLEAPGGTCLWLWQGWLPQDQGDGDSGTTGSSEVRWHAERRAAMGTVLEYRQAKHGTPPPPVRLCWAGHEPQVFVNYFSNVQASLPEPFVTLTG